MQKKIWNKVSLFAIVFIFAGIMAAASPAPVSAAGQQVKMSSCKLNSKGKKLTVKAKVNQKTSAMGKKLYLLGLNANVSETGKKSASPLASVKTKKGTITFKVDYKSSMLYQKFAVAYKTGKKYKIVSDARYITNPEALASFKGKGPSAASKKGLQVEELSDSLEIGTKHAVINWTLNSIMNNNAANKMSITYKNKKYTLDADQIQRNDEQVQAYNAAGVRVTVILLLPKDASSKGTASMQFGGGSYTQFSSIKTSSKAGCQAFEAVMTYLAQHYGTKTNLVSGWILGNEVNSAYTWNYGGNKGLDAYMANYARSFRICYNAVKSVSKYSKVYISLDNNWNKSMGSSSRRMFTSKATLDKFYEKLKAQGKVSFQIAFHAYPQGMSDPVFWDDTEATNSVKTKIINFKNISVLTKYAKKTFGKDCTIMLSEQSFNSTRGEAVQAAAYAYAYYISEGNSMIEAFIYGREFDHPSEMNMGYRWGLCDEWHAKRLIWHVFQYIDTADSFTFTDPLLQYLNISKWTKISGFKKTKFTKMASIRKQAMITDVSPASTTSLTVTWDKISSGDGYEVYRNGKLITTITGNSTVSYTDKNLTGGTAYQYQVRMYKEAPNAKNAEKRVKIYGTMSGAVTAVMAAPQVELNLTNCTVSGNKIKIAWKKITGAAGYEIYRSADAGVSYTLAGTAEGDKTSFTDTAPLSGVTYYYKVRAYITANGINYYGKDSDVTSQYALIQLSAGVVNGKLELNWSECANAINYRIFCKPQNEADFVRTITVNTLSHSLVSYKDAAGNLIDFVEGMTYSLRIRAVLSDGSLSKFSNTIEVPITQPIGSVGILQDEEEIPDMETEEIDPMQPDIDGTEESDADGTEEPDADEKEEPEAAVTEPAPEKTENIEPRSGGE